ncbi:MAG: sulfatase [Opitutales bacterium]|nr:sulfatase [Opitutales bacterium]
MTFAKLISRILVFGILATQLPVFSQEETGYNIVLIFADDMGYGEVGSFDPDSRFNTPRLDRLAEEGAKLTRFYVPTPYCGPSRGTILTGRYPFRHTVVGNPSPDSGQNNFGLPPSEVTIAELLKTKGYATAAYGKWHLGHREPWLPRSQGFDEYYGILYSNDMYPVQLVRDEEVVEYPVAQSKLSQLYTDLTIDFIERKKDQPFFVYLPHAMPHKPLAVSDDFYTPDTPGNLYEDVIAELDHCVGQVLDALDRLNLAEKTLVIFTSDNGPNQGGSTGGLRGMKGRVWDGGMRVPFIARLPGVIQPGIVNHHPAATVDILPTLSALAGVELPNDRTIDGTNILPMFKNNNQPSPNEAVFGMRGEDLACIWSGKWKLHVLDPGRSDMRGLSEEEAINWVDPRAPDGVSIIAPFEQAKAYEIPGLITGDAPKPMMLFDLSTDPGEQHDLSDEFPEVVDRLKSIYDRMNAQVPDFTAPESDYLFRDPEPGESRQLMHLIGGELRYDQVPEWQKPLLKD